jgi:hypothetical protein
MTAGLAASKRVSKGLTFAAMVYTERCVELPFVDAVGIALRVLEDVKTRAAHWFKVWVSMDKV